MIARLQDENRTLLARVAALSNRTASVESTGSASASPLHAGAGPSGLGPAHTVLAAAAESDAPADSPAPALTRVAAGGDAACPPPPLPPGPAPLAATSASGRLLPPTPPMHVAVIARTTATLHHGEPLGDELRGTMDAILEEQRKRDAPPLSVVRPCLRTAPHQPAWWLPRLGSLQPTLSSAA